MTHQTKEPRSANNLFNTPLMIRLAILIGRILPRKIGLALAALIGTILGSQRRSHMVRSIRANQYVIHNETLEAKTLNKLPKIVFRSVAKCTFDYFYYLSRPEVLLKFAQFSPESEAAFERVRQGQPTVIVCPHLSNFDLMGYVLALKGIEVQILSFPNPSASYKIQNQLRESYGLNVTPMDLNAFRQARKRLKKGGSVLTGLDRPLDSGTLEKYRPHFFGRPASLPVTYVRMAKEANAPVYIMAATYQPDGTYYLEGSPPFWMESADDLETEILVNTEKILKTAESLILQYARQWAMFYPIWPEFLGV